MPGGLCLIGAVLASGLVPHQTKYLKCLTLIAGAGLLLLAAVAFINGPLVGDWDYGTWALSFGTALLGAGLAAGLVSRSTTGGSSGNA